MQGWTRQCEEFVEFKKECHYPKYNYHCIVFDNLHTYLNRNNLISHDQSGFRPGDSNINQLISMTTYISNAFEKTLALDFDISKVFDKVWYQGLVFKLERSGVSSGQLSL